MCWQYSRPSSHCLIVRNRKFSDVRLQALLLRKSRGRKRKRGKRVGGRKKEEERGQKRERRGGKGEKGKKEVREVECRVMPKLNINVASRRPRQDAHPGRMIQKPVSSCSSSCTGLSPNEQSIGHWLTSFSSPPCVPKLRYLLLFQFFCIFYFLRPPRVPKKCFDFLSFD